MELPINIMRAVRRYQPITDDSGLTLFPVLVQEYEEFLIARPALEVLQQSFPVRFMRIPLLSALYQMDYEAALSHRIPTGLFSRATLLLCLSLRLGEGREIGERLKIMQVIIQRDNPANLVCLRFEDNAGETREIKPSQFQKLRKIIAAQNGVKLESDNANPDLVLAERDIAEANAPKLETSIDILVESAAALTGADENEIDNWPILKLLNRTDAVKRALDYLSCSIAEGQGTTWKGGNPVPHPFYPKIRDDNGGLISMSSFQKSALQSSAEYGNPI